MKKITLNAEHVRAAMAHASNERDRELLNGILLAKNGDIVGTDGRSLFLAKGSIAEPDRLTMSDNIIKIESAVPISTEWLKVDLEGSVVECWKNVAIHKRIPFRIVLGTFPNYEKVLPGDPNIDQPYNDTVLLTAVMLQKVAKTWGKDAILNIKSNGVNEPLSVTSQEHSGLIVVMPCRCVKGDKIGQELVRRASVPLAEEVA